MYCNLENVHVKIIHMFTICFVGVRLFITIKCTIGGLKIVLQVT